MQKRFTPDAGGVFPEWEEKTIEEACNVNVSNGTPGDKFIYIELGDVNKYGLLKRKNLVRKNEAPVSAKRVAKIDDVFFRSVRPGNKGHFHYTNEMSEQVVMSSAFFQLSMKDGDNEFLYQTLNTQYFTKQVLTRCTGTTYPTISLNEFIKLKIKIPKSMEEQRKIAAALATYDEMIAVKTAKLETWQECKKRMVTTIKMSTNFRMVIRCE
jgi:type I restriction enzyme S subunit